MSLKRGPRNIRQADAENVERSLRIYEGLFACATATIWIQQYCKFYLILEKGPRRRGLSFSK